MTTIQALEVRRTVTTRVVTFRLPNYPGGLLGPARILRTTSMRRYLAVSRSGGWVERRSDNLASAEAAARKCGGFVVDTWIKEGGR